MLKKISRAASIAVFVFCAFSGAAAQSDTFNDEDLQKLQEIAQKNLEGKTYRKKETYQRFENGSAASFSKITITNEILPPDRSRFVVERETAEGIKRYERIRVGSQVFERHGDGEWKDVSGKGFGAGSGGGTGSYGKVETTVERKLRKGEMVNNKMTDHYEITTTTKFVETMKIFVRRNAYWFDVNGMFVKTEYEFGVDLKSTTLTTTEYEYDPTIKIEAPTLSTKSSEKN